MSERDVGCLHAFSDFLDEIEDLNSLGDAACSPPLRRRDDDLPPSEDDCPPLLRSWLGMGWYGAERHAALYGASCDPGTVDDANDVLQLFADDAAEDLAVAEQCAMVRSTIITELCGTLIPKMSTLHVPNSSGSSSSDVLGFQHSLHRLVASQITRERWLYPLRFLLPQVPVMVASRAADIFNHGVTSDLASTMDTRLKDLTALVDSVIAEVVFSPAKLLKRAFALFETLVDMILTHARLQLQAGVHQLLQVTSSISGGMDADCCLMDLVDASADGLKSKMALVFHAAGGSEVHWLFLTSLIKALHQEGADAARPPSSDATSATVLMVAWREVVRRVGEWLSPNPALCREHSKTRGVAVEKFFGFGSIDHRRACLAEATSTLVPEAQSDRLVYRDEQLHLAMLPDSLRWTTGSAQASAGRLLAAMQPLLIGRHRSPKQPPWMASVDSTQRMMRCFDMVSWSSKVFGDTPEFPALLPERGCMTAERVASLFQLLAKHKDDSFVYSHVLTGSDGMEVWEKFVVSMAVVYPTIAVQLSEPQRSSFQHALVGFILGDVRAAPSSNVFDVNPYDVVLQFLTTVLPLSWDISSVHRLRESLRSYTDALIGQSSSTFAFGRFLDVVLASVMQCITETLVSLRYDFEAQDSGDRCDGTTCFASEDVDLLSGYLTELVEKVFCGGCPSERHVDAPETMAAMDVTRDDAGVSETNRHVGLSSTDHWWSDGGEWGASTAIISSSALHPAVHQRADAVADGDIDDAGLSNRDHALAVNGQTKVAINALPNTTPMSSTASVNLLQRVDESTAVCAVKTVEQLPPPPLLQHRLHALLIPSISWLVGDILVPVSHDGDIGQRNASRVLNSDAMMHNAVGLAVGNILHALIAHCQTWSVATITVLTHWIVSLHPSHAPALRTHSTPSTLRHFEHHTVIGVNDVMRLGLMDALHRDQTMPCMIEPHLEDVRVCRTISNPPAVARALDTEKGIAVKRVYEAWAAFTEWCH